MACWDLRGRGGESRACAIVGPSIVLDAGSDVLFCTLDQDWERERERETETEVWERTKVVVTEPAVLVVRFRTRRRRTSPGEDRAVSGFAPTRDPSADSVGEEELESAQLSVDSVGPSSHLRCRIHLSATGESSGAPWATAFLLVTRASES